jgi:hypothetical protein
MAARANPQRVVRRLKAEKRKRGRYPRKGGEIRPLCRF